MATSSIFNNIQITDEKSAKLLVDAMDAADSFKEKAQTESVKYRELKDKELSGFFKEK